MCRIREFLTEHSKICHLGSFVLESKTKKKNYPPASKDSFRYGGFKKSVNPC